MNALFNPYFQKIFESSLERVEDFRVELGTLSHPYREEQLSYLDDQKRNSMGAFFWVHDLREGVIMFPHNAQTYLGLREFSYQEWLGRIHPYYILFYVQYGISTYDLIFNKMDIPLSFCSHVYQISVPVLSRDNKTYMWVTQNIKPFGFDVQGKMVRQLNIYQVGADYKEEFHSKVIQPKIVDENHQRRKDWEELIRKHAGGELYSSILSRILTERQLDVLELDAEGKTNAEIRTTLEISGGRLSTIRHEILERQRAAFLLRFDTAREFARYCRQLYMI